MIMTRASRIADESLRPSRFVLVAMLAFSLMACGGAGGSGGASSDGVSGTSPPPPPPTPSLTVSLSVSPIAVSSGGSSTLTWSTTNATSCSASGAWTGSSKGTSGSQSTGPLASSSTYTLDCTGTSGSVQKSVTVVVYSGLPPSGDGLTMPSLDDERNTYSSWGWTWTVDKEPSAVTEPVASYYIADPGVHNITEGDDLWTYAMMYRRTNNSVYLNRALAWARYFKEDYRTNCSNYYESFCGDRDNYNLDHLYGWGLVTWYEHTCKEGSCDFAALAEAEKLAEESEKIYGSASYTPGLTRMSEYGMRRGGRHLMLATRVAEATGSARWAALRDKLIELWLQSLDWDAALGMYFVGDWQTDYVLGAGAYSAGTRIQSPFHVGILTEALYQAYRTTGRSDLRDRLVAMAEFVYQSGLDPTYQYTGEWFGWKNSKPFHKDNSTQSTVLNCTIFWDPVYTTSLVNTLVMGYKFTGERRYYDRARVFFNRGTKGIFGQACERAAADGAVHHFVDTVFSSASGYYMLKYNKGELRYTYLLFENGGDPSVLVLP